MPKLPVVKPKFFVKFLEKQGFVQVRSDGSHLRFHYADGRKVTVPYHNEPFKKGTLKAILRQAEMTTEFLVQNL